MYSLDIFPKRGFWTSGFDVKDFLSLPREFYLGYPGILDGGEYQTVWVPWRQQRATGEELAWRQESEELAWGQESKELAWG